MELSLSKFLVLTKVGTEEHQEDIDIMEDQSLHVIPRRLKTQLVLRGAASACTPSDLKHFLRGL